VAEVAGDFLICSRLAKSMDMMLDFFISNYGYAHIFSKIFDSAHWTIVFVGHCMNWDNLECVNFWIQVELIVIPLKNTSIRTQRRNIYGSKVGTMKLKHTQYLNVTSGHTSWRLQIDLTEDMSVGPQLIFGSIMASTNAVIERRYL
jgi:hypothetical protein